jgi:hypothetical protein
MIALCLSYQRKPWFYGIPNKNPKLKSLAFRRALVSLFIIHTVVAIIYATKNYFNYFFS